MAGMAGILGMVDSRCYFLSTSFLNNYDEKNLTAKR